MSRPGWLGAEAASGDLPVAWFPNLRT